MHAPAALRALPVSAAWPVGGRAAWPAGLAAGLIAWHGLAGFPGYRLAGSRSAVWRLPASESAGFRDLARPDLADLRLSGDVA
jgi:hypothetical protein